MGSVTPIIMVGAAGRMGRTILDCAGRTDEDFDLIAAIDSPKHPLTGQDLRGLVPSAPEGLTLSAAPPAKFPAGTVLIIFSLIEPTLEYLAWAEANGCPVVIGTTGFGDEQLAHVARASQKIPVIHAPNTSVGVNVLYELVKLATQMLGESFDIEITEMHHNLKKDAPSGTARRLAEVALAVRGGDYAEDVEHGRSGMTGERIKGKLGMHALRGGDVVGDHTVTFAGMGERIELTHRAHGRENFARGALRAATWLHGQKPGLYGMKDVLGL